jgi:hypothetical protein
MLVPVAGLILAGCGETRPQGDPGGVPVAFAVHLESGYLSSMSMTSALPSTGLINPHPYYRPYYAPGRRYYNRSYSGPYYYYDTDPFWYAPAYTDVYLLAGDGPGQGRLFRVTLDREETTFTVPIRPGHEVTLTVQVHGYRDGWEAVGHFTASGMPSQHVNLALSPEGPQLTESGPVGPPPPP